ncbi:MAG TPA: helix-turn-helix domain-containing protein [Xanthobacteraceae bacterium]|nr:helix-turn-helix domain-containing protein [Xanthobacteraceae bacterium]
MLNQSAIRSDVIRRPAIQARNGLQMVHGFDAEQGESLAQHMQLMGAIMSYPRNAEIFGENEPAEYLYKVVAGAVRTYKVLSDGRRQVGGFYLPGDVFGLEFADEHVLAAEAVTDAKVLVVRRSALAALANSHAGISRELYALTARELRRVQDRILLLIKSAQERVASFLLEMSERCPAGDCIELPMSRQDIADYLGLTIETVSRTLTSLESAAAIEVPTSRRIVLRDRGALCRLNG